MKKVYNEQQWEKGLQNQSEAKKWGKEVLADLRSGLKRLISI